MTSINFGVPSGSHAELLLSLSVKVDESVNEVRDARADVEEVDKLIVKVEVDRVRHVPLPDLLLSILNKEALYLTL